jgi:DNA-directed RNA polymerase subunit RPC12/RpoP
MWEADFTISCSQCGGQDFQQVFPVPAEVYRVYQPGERGSGQELVAAVYVCLQCGHLEKFVDLGGAPEPGDREVGGGELATR